MKDPEYIQGAERAFQRLALVEQGSIAPKLAEISPDRLRRVAPELLRPDLRIINPVQWRDEPVPEREWIVRDMIPAKTVTLLSGDGAVGKSTLGLQLATARALGRDWIGTMPTPGRTLYLSAEDDTEELHRRLDSIREHYGATFDDMADIQLVDLVGENAVLGEISKTGIIHATPTFEAVVSVIERTRADLVVWAGLLFGSGGLCARLTNASEENENDFRLLTRRCRRCRIAVLLDLRPAAARAILAPKEPALDWVSSGMPTWSQRALQAETRMSGIAQIDTEQSGKAVVSGASLPDDDHATV
jgi:AAA domain